jgi:hypothetical protein
LTSISWRSILISPSGIKVIYILKSLIILRGKLCIMDQKKAGGGGRLPISGMGGVFKRWELDHVNEVTVSSTLMTPQRKSKYPRIAGVHGYL